jgi:hypothetical protein
MSRGDSGFVRPRVAALLAALLGVILYVGVRVRMQPDPEDGFVADGAYFSEDYRTARDRFRRAAIEAEGDWEALTLSATGPLTIDMAWFGAAAPRRALVHASGIHGVEAFAGSAIQLRLIESLPALPQDMAVVFVHVLNPYGMAWLRRVNENNVDLNRNFLQDDGQGYSGHPEGYAALHDFLNPSELPALDLFVAKAGWLLLRHGRSAMEASVVTGQYDYPRGLFFGGSGLQEGPRLYEAFLLERLGGAEELFVIDVHTGLGPFGEDTILVSNGDYERMRELLGNRVEAFSSDDEQVAYEIRGGHHEGVEALLDGNVDFVGQEFGTYGQIRILNALRRENQLHHFGQPRVGDAAKRELRDAFYPEDSEWRQRVLARGVELFDQALEILEAR